jgi:T5SS/PEP-CTERM-associated repeat protein
MTIRDGAVVESVRDAGIGHSYTNTVGVPPGYGTLTVDGDGSMLQCGDGTYGLYLGYSKGTGYLNVINGGEVQVSGNVWIGGSSLSYGEVLVRDSGSTVTMTTDLIVARYGNGSLKITNGGLVKVGGALSMNLYGNPWNVDLPNNGFVAISNDGKLALKDVNSVGSGSISGFLGLIDLNGPSNDGIGTTDIKYWNGSAWTNIFQRYGRRRLYTGRRHRRFGRLCCADCTYRRRG